jgi:ribosomal protein S18 acetylase RimI-like enzyme
MIIKPYDKDDLNGVIKLWREVFPDNPPHNDPADDIRRKLKIQSELFFVAREGSEIVGTAMGGYDGHRGWIYYVAVSNKYRRRGIGSALMKKIEAELAKIGCHKLNLQVREGNEEVIAFYESLGYTVEPRTSMAKHLKPAP